MANLAGSTIIARAADVLQDSSNVRWPLAEQTRWINSGQREIVLLRPDAKTLNASVTLVAGTKQALPTAGLKLIDVVRNMGVAGTTPGNVIRPIAREVLDAQIPTWHVDANTSGVIKHFTFDLRDPKRYYVYPLVPATPVVQVEIVYSLAPTNLTDGASLIDLDDIYEGPLLNYLLFRGYSKDAEYAGDANKATMYYNLFLAGLGIKTRVDMAVSPNSNVRVLNPNVPERSAVQNQPGVTGGGA